MQNGVGGTTLHYWAQSWRLNPWDFKVVSETTRRYGASRIPEGLDGRRLAVRLRRARAVLRQDRVRSRRLRSGRQHQRQDRSARQPVRRRRASATTRCRRCAARRSSRRWRRPRRRSAGIRFPGPAAINSRTYQNRSGCMYHGFCNRGGCHVDAKNSTAVTTIPRAQATGHLKVVTRAHVTTIEVDGSGRDDRRQLRDRRRRVLPAGEGRAARQLHLREHPAAAAVEVEGVSQRAVEQPRAGRAPLLQPSPGRAGVGAVSVQPRQLVRPAGAGRRGRQLGGRQLRSRGPRLHRRRQPVGDVRQAADRARPA